MRSFIYRKERSNHEPHKYDNHLPIRRASFYAPSCRPVGGEFVLVVGPFSSEKWARYFAEVVGCKDGSVSPFVSL